MTRIVSLNANQLAAMGIRSAPKASRAVMKAARDEARGVVQGKPVGDNVGAPAYEVNDVFQFQSYFDSTLQERALLRQNPNELIVKSTLSDLIQTAGYGLALTPSSETPVAVQFETGAQQGASATYRLKPGEVIFPQGEPGGEPGFFTGFQWGLPFGWLGGGSATLVVLRSPDAKVTWASDHNEIVYHRIRLPIWTGAELEFPATAGFYTGPLNWPQRFPWPAAIFGTDSLTQRGQPALAVMPTRTAIALVNSSGTITTASDVRIFFVGADIWAQTATNTIPLNNVKFTDITWGTYAAYNAGVAPPAPFNIAEPQQILIGEMERIACNAGAILCVGDPAGEAGGLHMDFVRFGRL